MFGLVVGLVVFACVWSFGCLLRFVVYLLWGCLRVVCISVLGSCGSLGYYLQLLMVFVVRDWLVVCWVLRWCLLFVCIVAMVVGFD